MYVPTALLNETTSPLGQHQFHLLDCMRDDTALEQYGRGEGREEGREEERGEERGRPQDMRRHAPTSTGIVTSTDFTFLMHAVYTYPRLLQYELGTKGFSVDCSFANCRRLELRAYLILMRQSHESMHASSDSVTPRTCTLAKQLRSLQLEYHAEKRVSSRK